MSHGSRATFAVFAWPGGEPADTELEEFYRDPTARMSVGFWDGGRITFQRVTKIPVDLAGVRNDRLRRALEAIRRNRIAVLESDAPYGNNVLQHVTATGELPVAVRGRGGRLYVNLGLSGLVDVPALDRVRAVVADDKPVRLVALRVAGEGDAPEVSLYAPVDSVVRFRFDDTDVMLAVSQDGLVRRPTQSQRESLTDGAQPQIVEIDVSNESTSTQRISSDHRAELSSHLPQGPPSPMPPFVARPGEGGPHTSSSELPVDDRVDYVSDDDTASYREPVPYHGDESFPFDVATDVAPQRQRIPARASGGRLQTDSVVLREVDILDNPHVSLNNWTDRGRSGVLFASRIAAAAIDTNHEVDDVDVASALYWVRLSIAGHRPPRWGREAIVNALSGPLASVARSVRAFYIGRDKYFVRARDTGALVLIDEMGLPVTDQSIQRAIAERCGTPFEVAFPHQPNHKRRPHRSM